MANTAYEALRNDAAWIDLTERGKVLVTGEDAGRLLHAMTTNNVKDLAIGVGLYAFFLNDKGRILADANIFNMGNGYWIDTEPETGSKIHHLLDKYIIADDAEVKDETAEWFAVGVEGPASEAVMKRMSLPIPEHDLGLVVTEWGRVARIAVTGKTGFRVWADDGRRAQIWNELAASGMPQAMHEDVKVVRLENGIPRYGEDISERYLVQETQALHGVHFDKGCYLGQEIVERVRSRGQVHRLLTKLQIHSSVPLSGKLMMAGAEVGEITSAAFSPAFGHVVGLGYVRAEIIQSRAEMVVAGTDPEVRAHL